jgi:Cu-Zn family superoxide dismutase
MNAIVVFEKNLNNSNNYRGIEGTIQMSQANMNQLVFVQFDLRGFPPNGEFGCHVHRCGDLRKGCESACEHFDPYGRLHGRYEYYGLNRHVGDLAIPDGNLKSDKDGRVHVGFYDDLISLFPNERCVIGRMIVIHEKKDDGGIFRGENTELGKESGKTGNAGKRVACAIIGLAK